MKSQSNFRSSAVSAHATLCSFTMLFHRGDGAATTYIAVPDVRGSF